MHIPQPLRRAFSLAELLVAIAILGLLAGLLVPAVQKVRESANRTRCDGNLHQIGVALHQFDSQYRGLPRAFGTYPEGYDGRQPPNTMSGSVLFMLLPMMGEEPVFSASYSLLNGGFYLYAQVARREVKSYVCPSDPTYDRAGLGNYLANEAVFLRFQKPKYRLDSIPDGCSQTIVFSERVSRYLDKFGNLQRTEWAGYSAYYSLHSGVPERVTGLRVGGAFEANSAHVMQPTLMADGAVRRIAFPVSQTRWIRASSPDDSFGWDFDS